MAAAKRPNLFFTVQGQSRSEQVVAQLKHWAESEPRFIGARATFRIIEHNQVAEFFRHGGFTGIFPETAVVLFDLSLYRKCFEFFDFRQGSPVRPSWAPGVSWGVGIGERGLQGTSSPLNVTAQTAANFLTHFDARIKRGELPWGPRRQVKEPTYRRRRRRVQSMMF